MPQACVTALYAERTYSTWALASNLKRLNNSEGGKEKEISERSPKDASEIEMQAGGCGFHVFSGATGGKACAMA